MLSKKEQKLLKLFGSGFKEDARLGQINFKNFQLSCRTFVDATLQQFSDEFLFRNSKLKMLYSVESPVDKEHLFAEVLTTISKVQFNIKRLDPGIKAAFDILTPAILLSEKLPLYDLVKTLYHELCHAYLDILKSQNVNLCHISIVLYDQLKDFILEDRLIETIKQDFEKVKRNGPPQYAASRNHCLTFILKSYNLDIYLDRPLGHVLAYQKHYTKNSVST